MIKTGIIGATGYAGAELVRLLLMHTKAKLTAVSSVSFEGKAFDEIYPNFISFCSDILTDEDTVIEQSDVIFTAVPHGLSQPLAKKCVEKGKVIIDIGADFRLCDEEVYKKYYGGSFLDKELHNKSVYGLPELNREKINNTDIIANPGCYPTSAELALYPALNLGLVNSDGIIIDSKSGVTGAGRNLTENTHFPECNESLSAYNAAVHRHAPEIKQTLGQMAGENVSITFVPHLVPINRGILTTVYAKLKIDLPLDEIYAKYLEFYSKEKFVRVLPLGSYAKIKNVKYSNFCDISLHLDKDNGVLIITSVIDNMGKGAAGQAIQNMNIRFGIEETCGLELIPPAF